MYRAVHVLRRRGVRLASDDDTAGLAERLLDRVRVALRARHCSLRTEKAYWVDAADIRTVQELLGHRDVTTTMIYI